MDGPSRSFRAVRLSLGVVSVCCVVGVILLMPTLPAIILAAGTLVLVPFALLRNSRRAALIVDFLLLALLLASHLLPYSQRTAAGPLDIVSLVLILSFHEFSSIYSDARELELSYIWSDSAEAVPPSHPMVQVALVHRILLVSGILLASALVSEGYFLAARGASASLYSIYGVAAGLMTVIIFLYLLIAIASRKPEK